MADFADLGQGCEQRYSELAVKLELEAAHAPRNFIIVCFDEKRAPQKINFAGTCQERLDYMAREGINNEFAFGYHDGRHWKTAGSNQELMDELLRHTQHNRPQLDKAG